MPDRWFDGVYYNREITLNYMDCDTGQKVFLHYMLGIFSEIAGDESQAKGKTHKTLMQKGRVFLITRMSIRLHRTPAVNETLIFRTWVQGAEDRFFFRDCDVRSPQGTLIASISGTWVLMDVAGRRILGVESLRGAGNLRSGEKADSPECKKVVPAEPLPVLGRRPVYFTDLDCNYHINNTVYTKIATDFLPAALQNRETYDFVINFNKETRLGETLELRGGGDEDGYIIQGYCDGALHYGCEFIFRR
jgi:acyl-ACP thioesterase